MSNNILLKSLLLRTVGNVGYTALGAAAQAQQEKTLANIAMAKPGLKGKRKADCTPCAGRALVAQVQRKYLG